MRGTPGETLKLVFIYYVQTLYLGETSTVSVAQSVIFAASLVEQEALKLHFCTVAYGTSPFRT